MTMLGQRVLPAAELGSVPAWRQVLRGFSQCTFQANEITGVLLVAAAFAYHWRMGVFYVISVLLGTAVASAVKGIPDLRDLGLYGFNSGLMGLALAALYQPNAALWIAMVVCAVIVAVLAVLASRFLPFPFLAAPFIATFWVLWPIAESIGLRKVPLSEFPEAPVQIVKAAVAALGSTLFAPSVLAGILVLIALLIASVRAAVIAVFGAILGLALARHVGSPGESINSGFMGFNAVLAALGVNEVVGHDLRLIALGAIGATWIFSYLNRTAPVPALASGFVLIVWAILLLGWLNGRFFGTSATADNEAPAS
jgi:urea transporter